MTISPQPADSPENPARWTPEGTAFLRRVMACEVYTGMSGTALALWAVGIHDEPRDRPLDGADFRRCMNVYWSAPESLRPKMRAQLETWSERLRRQAGGKENWRYTRPNFDVPTYYLPDIWHQVRL